MAIGWSWLIALLCCPEGAIRPKRSLGTGVVLLGVAESLLCDKFFKQPFPGARL